MSSRSRPIRVGQDKVDPRGSKGEKNTVSPKLVRSHADTGQLAKKNPVHIVNVLEVIHYVVSNFFSACLLA